MKKFAKLSLIASLAVASFSAANAQDLTEAIKNVDVSGTVTYRYNDYEKNDHQNNYKIGLNVASKVNEDVTANTRFLVESFGMNAANTADGQADVVLSEVNFAYTGVNNLSVTVGKQGVATPFTVHRDAMGAESTGTGILAAYSLKPVTFAGAYFNQSNITGLTGEDLATLGVMASFAGINAEAWYLDVSDTLDAYTVALNASYNVGSVKLSPEVRYSKRDDDNSADKKSLFKAGMGLSAGIFDAYVGYGETDKNGGVAIDGNSSATTFDQHWRVGLFDQRDADILFANVGAKVANNVHVSLKHSKLDVKSSYTSGTTTVADAKETYVQVVYNMSSNLVSYVRFGEYKKEGEEAQTSGRLHVQYSF